MTKRAWIAASMVAGVMGFGAACGDDAADDDPDVPADDGGVEADVPVETTDDADVPDEPIGPGDYPPGPYGVAVGDRIDNLRFVDIEGNPLSLADVHADTSVKLLWIYATAGWCSVCGIESARLPSIWTAHNPAGLQILAVIFEDGTGNPADVRYASSYAGRYRFPFPAVADEPFVLGRYFDKAATPMNMLVDLTDMEILRIEMGWDESGLSGLVERYLSEIADRD